MIYGIGIDLVDVKRLKKWVKDSKIISRFFNDKELYCTKLDISKCEDAMCQHYAVRFAAKEAFAKALGTGICGFNLKDVYIQKDANGKPYIKLENSALELFNKICFSTEQVSNKNSEAKNANILVSLTHEKTCAAATVIIEIA